MHNNNRKNKWASLLARNRHPAQEQPQTFAGKIVKSKGDWVLKDQATGTMYKLDNEDQAKQYAGKNVKVTGTVDTATNTIHIANIEMGASEPSSPK